MKIAQYLRAKRTEDDRAVLLALRWESEDLFAGDFGQDSPEFVMDAGWRLRREAESPKGTKGFDEADHEKGKGRRSAPFLCSLRLLNSIRNDT